MGKKETIRKESMDLCEGYCVHEEAIHKVEKILPDEKILFDLAEIYKIFGDLTRIKILFILMKSEMCVCDLSEMLGMTQSAISHQLRTLKQSKLVKARREGKSVFYSLSDSHVETILNQGMEHISE